MTSKAESQFKALIKNGLLTAEDIVVIKAWLNEMEAKGPEFIKHSKRWDDHELNYEWQGYRASCFSGPGRIIYKIIQNIVVVEVHRVTPDHNYKKRTLR